MHTTCPDRGRLRDCLQGHLPEDESGPILDHLNGCERCEDAAGQLEREGDWLTNHLSVAGQHADDSPRPWWLPNVRAAFDDDTDVEVEKPEPSPFEHPIELGAYEVQSVLGRGGMGIVYRALHRRLGKSVALKVVTARDAVDAVPRFEREMRAIGAVNHPAIVQATDADTVKGRAFLVMELVDGIDLRILLKLLGPLAPADACAIIAAACQGVQAAHEAGVVHRDLKPSNIMLNRQGQTKILDFGLARLREDLHVGSMSTSFGRLVGTLDYLAPEQAGGGAADARADVYGLAATLFALLAGQPAFGRSSDGPLIHYLQRLATEDPPALTDLRGDVPDGLSDLLAAALARDPEHRLQTAGEFAEHLEDFSQGSDLTALAGRALAERENNELPADELQQDLATSISELGITRSSVKTPKAESKKVRSWAGLWMPLLLLIGLGFGGWLGIAVVLNTGEGVLRIESTSANVRVTVHKNADLVKDLRVDQGDNTVRLWAGRYQVQIDEPSDGLRLSQNSVRVMRGETVVVTVTTAQPTEGNAKPIAPEVVHQLPVILGVDGTVVQDSATPEQDLTLGDRLRRMKQLPVWDGKRPEEWLRILNSERQPERRIAAIKAIIGLADDLEPHIAAELLIHAGSATVEDFIGNNPNRMAVVVASSPALWSDDGASPEPILDRLRLTHSDSSRALAMYLRPVVDQLASLSAETVLRASYEAVPNEDLAGKTILLSALLHRALTTEPNPREADIARNRLVNSNPVGKTLTILEQLVLVTLEPTRIHELALHFQGQSLGQNSAEAALALRLARVFPNNISAVSRIQVLMRGIAHNDFELAAALYSSRRVRPIDRHMLGNGVAEIIPVLQAALDRPGFVTDLLKSDFQPLDVLLAEWTPHLDESQLLERVLARLAQYRDTAQLSAEVGQEKSQQRYAKIGKRFAETAALYTQLHGRLPEAVTVPVTGSGDLPRWFKEWQEDRRSQYTIEHIERLKMLVSWYPYDLMRHLLEDQNDFAPTVLGHIGVQWQHSLWLATASKVAGTSSRVDNRIAATIAHSGIGGGGGMAMGVMGVMVDETGGGMGGFDGGGMLATNRPPTFADHQVLSPRGKAIHELLDRWPATGRLANDIAKSAGTNQLRSSILLVLTNTGYFRSHGFPVTALREMISDSDVRIALQAMVAAAQHSVLTAEPLATPALERLREPPLDAELGESGRGMAPYRLQRLKLLVLFDDRQKQESLEQLVNKIRRDGPKMQSQIQSAITLSGDVVTEHTLAAELRLLRDLPERPNVVRKEFQDWTRSIHKELIALYQALSETFEQEHGRGLKDEFEAIGIRP